MTLGEKIGTALSFCIVGIILSVTVAYITPGGRAAINKYFFDVQKADDTTRYETKKKVEDTCRAMIASYNSDKLAYEQYKESDNEEKQSWAEQAKMRANKTVSTYNNYILENSFVWEGNIPNNIAGTLEVLE